MDEWSLIFYTAPSGRRPVQEFLDDLHAPDAARVVKDLQLLKQFGARLKMPHVRPLTGTELWELRSRGRVQHRVIFVAMTDRRILLLHAFAKKTEQTPDREIRTALDRLADFRRQPA